VQIPFTAAVGCSIPKIQEPLQLEIDLVIEAKSEVLEHMKDTQRKYGNACSKRVQTSFPDAHGLCPLGTPHPSAAMGAPGALQVRGYSTKTNG